MGTWKVYPGSKLVSAESDSFVKIVSVSAGAFFVSDLSDSGSSISSGISSHLDFPFPLFLSLPFPLSEGYG